MTYSERYLQQSAQIAAALDAATIERAAHLLAETREGGGRLFIIGVGGGAGHASHAVCDFRKIAGFEAYAPSDNASELTARINDEGWDTVYSAWLEGSRIRSGDALLVFSVGGGDEHKNISVNLVRAIKVAKDRGARVIGVVGRDGGYTAKAADVCVIVPTVDPQTVTVQTESFQALIWHLLVSHPLIQRHGMKWESTEPAAARRS